MATNGSPACSYDAFARLRVILLNENAIVYDYCPKSGHCTRNGRSSLFSSNKNDAILKNITELVLGSVALNYGQHLPVTKMHRLSDRLMATSLVFGHMPTSNGCGSPMPSIASSIPDLSCHAASSPTPSTSGARTGWRSPMPIKYGLTVLWETTAAERELVQQFIRKEGHLLDCFMTALKDAMLEGVALRSASALNDATRAFLDSVHCALAANYLSNNVSLEMYARELIALVRRNDIKSNGFFVTRLLSTVLAFCDRKHPDANIGKQIVITTGEQERRPLLERLLIVLSYFVNDSLPLRRDLSDQPEADVTLPESFCPHFDRDEFEGTCDAVHDPHVRKDSTYTMSTNNSSDDLVKLRRRNAVVNTPSHSRAFADTKVTIEPPPLLNAIPKRLTSEINKSGPNSTSGRKSRDESLGYGSLSDSGSSNELMAADEPVDTMDARLMEELAHKLTVEANITDCDQVDSDGSSFQPLLKTPVNETESRTRCCGQRSSCWPRDPSLESDDDVVVSKEMPPNATAMSTKTVEQTAAGDQPTEVTIDLNESNGSLDQSKLYMKEYLNLRFHSPPCVGHDRTCFSFEDQSGCEGDLDTPGSSADNLAADITLRTKQHSENKRDSMFAIFNERDEDLEDSAEQVRPSRAIPGFLEIDLPGGNVSGASASARLNSNYPLEWQPMSLRATLNENRVLAHGQLQAVFVGAKQASLLDMLHHAACECEFRTTSVLHVDLDTWSVNIINPDNGNRLQEGLQSSLIGNICESLAAFSNFNLNPQFIIGYLETKLNELQLKSQLLSTLIPKNHRSPVVMTRQDSFRSASPYLLNPLQTMSRSSRADASRNTDGFYPSDSGIETSFGGHSFSSSCTAISVDTVRAAIASCPNIYKPPQISPSVGIEASDVPLLTALIERNYVDYYASENYYGSNGALYYQNSYNSNSWSSSYSGRFGSSSNHCLATPPVKRIRTASAIAETAL